MYSGNNRLGEAPEVSFESIFTPAGVPSGDILPGRSSWMPEQNEDVSDPDLIAIPFYSPDANYPVQRISNYDLPLEEHETLNAYPNGSPMKLPAYEKGFLGSIGKAQYRMFHTRPYTAGVLTPRHEPAALKQTLMLTAPVKAGQEILRPRKLSMRMR